tara:strand:+ start:112 stop:894 length:783 start_codon:yes stop_codon:yes gene_type:complete
MSLVITLPERSVGGKKSPWEEKGVSEDDFEMAKEIGLLEDEVINDEFDSMIEEQEDILQEGLNFLDEIELWYDKRPRAIEVLQNNKVYKNIEIRLVSIVNGNGFGTIDGYPTVFIPIKFCQDLTLYEIYRMDVKYLEKQSYPMIVTKVYPKVEPYVAAKIVGSESDEYIKVHVPKQNVGQMIGKKGCHLKNILDTAEFNKPELKEIWTDGMNNRRYSPKLNVHSDNGDMYTEIDVWIPKSPVNKNVKWNVLNDYVQKIYA